MKEINKQVLAIVSEEIGNMLHQDIINKAGLKDKVYAAIVDLVPAGNLAEDIANASDALALLIRNARQELPKQKVLDYNEYMFLLSQFINLTFQSTAKLDTIYQDILDHSVESITKAEVAECVEDLLADGTWQEQDIS